MKALYKIIYHPLRWEILLLEIVCDEHTVKINNLKLVLKLLIYHPTQVKKIKIKILNTFFVSFNFRISLK